MTEKIKTVVITGPTATGKTALAVELARRFDGEIVSIDSRQVYRGMDIGTGKDLGEYGEIPYHLIDVADPAAEEYNLARFCRRLRDTGVKTVIYTDISRDGKMQGTNLELYKELSQIEGLDIVASGGISSLKEIEILKNEVYGAILGKALYLGAIDLKEALKYSV